MLNYRVCVMGLWHLGSVISACLAELGYTVVGYDNNAIRIQNLNQGIPPVLEPGLELIVRSNLKAGRLHYTSDILEAVRGADYVFFTYDTEVDDDDIVDITDILDTARALAPALSNGVTIVVSSQVPVGTCDYIFRMIQKINPLLDFGIACVPENLQLGRAIYRFLNPDTIAIGTTDTNTYAKVEAFYQTFSAPKFEVNLRTAEMTKHAVNAYLASCISFANDLARLCALAGADVSRVIQLLSLDARVSPNAPLRPGLGFSGGTLARDIQSLRRLGEENGFNSPFFDGVWKANQLHIRAPLRTLREVYPDISGRVFSVLGLTYKVGTSVVRRSVSLDIIRELCSGGAVVMAYDPIADTSEVTPFSSFVMAPTIEAATLGSDALIVMTPWANFDELILRRIGEGMNNRVIIDADEFLEPNSVRRSGFIYLGTAQDDIK